MIFPFSTVAFCCVEVKMCYACVTMRSLAPKHLLLAGIALAVPALADLLARKAAGRGYLAWTGESPPRNPATRTVSWSQAILWTAIAGAIGGVARMASRKVLAERGLPAEK
ncbi:MAG: DUF4235 domain-containing protein [Akkermansiaceae bacterium]|nr:DUF4235 domain-containing protein [Akkermansiaceae bacterium]